MALGLYVYLKTKGTYLFSIASLIHFLVSIVALISFISIYFYELPTHHCPFCILQPEYGYVGYVLYSALLVGVVSGLGTGVIMPFRRIESLHTVIPPHSKKACPDIDPVQFHIRIDRRIRHSVFKPEYGGLLTVEIIRSMPEGIRAEEYSSPSWGGWGSITRNLAIKTGRIAMTLPVIRTNQSELPSKLPPAEACKAYQPKPQKEHGGGLGN